MKSLKDHGRELEFRNDLEKLIEDARHRGLSEVVELLEVAHMSYQDCQAEEIARAALIQAATLHDRERKDFLN